MSTPDGPESPDGDPRARLTIVNKKGMHARAAAMFAQLVDEYDAKVTVTAGGETVGGDSIMGLLMLGAACGTEIEIAATGVQAKEALAGLVRLIENRFEEEDFPGY